MALYKWNTKLSWVGSWFSPLNQWNPGDVLKRDQYWYLWGTDDKWNTRTFFIKSATQADTTDLAQAQAAYDWWKAWNNPIIIFWSDWTTNFHLTSDSHIDWNKLSFYEAYTGYSVISTDWDTQVHNTRLDLNYNASEEVTSISYTNQKLVKFLSTDVNYTSYWNTFTPTNPWHPATKKYVDDIVGNIETLLNNI